jgi:hypothetical protein
MKWVDREFYVLRAIGNGIVFMAECLADRIANRHRRYAARAYWHVWYAWRPVSIPEATVGSVVVPRHYVWLELVDRRRVNWFHRRYRSHTMPPGRFETHHYDHSVARWKGPVFKPLDQLGHFDLPEGATK